MIKKQISISETSMTMDNVQEVYCLNNTTSLTNFTF